MPRRKLTNPHAEVEGDELPELTPRQMSFVRYLLAGKGASDAYRLAYNCENQTPESVWVSASRARRHPKIVLWLEASREACLGSAVMTLADHLRELERLKTLAVKNGNLGAAVQAEQLRGKASGFYVDRIEDISAPRDPAAILDEIAAQSPELATQLAKERGIAWKPKAKH